MSTPPLTLPRDSKHHLLNLPGELREHIYDYVLAPYPKLLLRRLPPRRKSDRLIHCSQLRPKGNHHPAPPIDWRRNKTGILLVNKQCYFEAVRGLYVKTTVVFDRQFDLNYSFLCNVFSKDLEFVSTITIQHETTLDRRQRDANERSETHMWATIAKSLPNLKTLYIKLTINEHPDPIIPDWEDSGVFMGYANPETYYAVDQLNSMSWLQPLKEFGALKSTLRRLRVDLWDEPGSGMRASVFFHSRYSVAPTPAGMSDDQAYEWVQGRWACFYKALHRSMGIAIRDLILGRPEPLKGHLDVLRKFQSWKRNQYGVTGLFQSHLDDKRAAHFEVFACPRNKVTGLCQHGF